MNKFKTGDKVTFKYELMPNQILTGIIFVEIPRTYICTNNPRLNGGWREKIKDYRYAWSFDPRLKESQGISEVKKEEGAQTYRITNTGKEFNFNA